MPVTGLRHWPRIDRWLEEELAAGRLFGGALAVVCGGAPVLRHWFGHRDRAGRAPVTRDSVYWIASMTKPLTSVAALQLVDEGVLSLDAPVAAYLRGFGDAGVLAPDGRTTPSDRPVTVLDLMRHTSGLTYGIFGDDAIHRAYARAQVYDFAAPNRVMAERIAALPLLHQPGTVFEYGMSTDVLAAVIEVAAGRPFEVVVAERVTGPLGMASTGFRPPRDRVVESAPGIFPPLSPDQRWCSGGAGLWSTLDDYLAFAMMLRAGGRHGGRRLMSRESFALMTGNQLPDGVGYGAYTGSLDITAPWPRNGLGFGLGLAVRLRAGGDVPGGVGEVFWPGVSGANFWVDPAGDVVVVFMTHSLEHRVRHRRDLRRHVYAELAARNARAGA